MIVRTGPLRSRRPLVPAITDNSIVWAGQTASGTYVFTGSKVDKTAGVGYVGTCYSNQGGADDFTISAIVPTGIESYFGLKQLTLWDNPVYNNKEYAFYLAATQYYIGETQSGANTAGPFARSAGDVFSIVRSGANITYFVNGVQVRTVATATGKSLVIWCAGNTLGTIITSATVTRP